MLLYIKIIRLAIFIIVIYGNCAIIFCTVIFMTIKESERILGIDPIFFPYSKKYLDAVYKRQIRIHFSGKVVDTTSNDFKSIRRAYDFLLKDIKTVNETIDPSLHISNGLTEDDERRIADYFLGISTAPLSEELMDAYQGYYFALCELIPEETLRKEVRELGGFRAVLKSQENLQCLAYFFGVSKNKIAIRLTELYLFDAKGDKATKERTIKVRFLRKRGKLY